ncbi:MAG TPA: ATP-binding protein, partial [Thermoanaerobaculia bacterium]|nr:ATP-binding protein [Thermoanaerobaculia bacterium]
AWRSLERQLPFLASALVLFALAVYGFAALREVRNALMAAGRSRLSSVTQQLNGLFQQSAQLRLQEMRSLAARQELAAFLAAPGAANRAAAEAALWPIVGANPQQNTEAVLCDATGAVQLRLGSSALGELAPLPRSPLPGLAPFQVQKGTVFYDSAAGIFGPRRQLLGHLTVRRFLSSPQSAKAINQLIGAGAALLIGNQGGGLWTDMARAVPAPRTDLIAAQKAPVESRSRAGAPVIGRAAAVPGTPWMVWVELDQAVLLAPMQALEGRFAGAGLLVLVLAAAAAWGLSRSITRPIRQMTLTAEAMAGGDFARRVDEPGQSELGRLARAFNHMTRELAASREQLEQRVESRTRELGHALAQLQQAQEELVREEKLAVLGRLASSVGHELRNPLGVMTNAIYYLEIVLREARPEVREYLGILRHEIGLSEKIVGDLLDFARLKPPRLQAFQLPDLVERQIERLGALDGVRIDRRFAADLPAAWADPAQVGQILLNLLTNAAQAVADRAGTITVRGSRRGERLLLEVEDDGAGVPPDIRERIFEPLFTTKARGIGLGLSVSQSLAEANAGSLRLEPAAARRGAVFLLELPAPAP